MRVSSSAQDERGQPVPSENHRIRARSKKVQAGLRLCDLESEGRRRYFLLLLFC
jgi:hypothetical protein